MTIDFVTPLPRSTIGAGDSVSFTIADTYTQMDIQAEGVNAYTTAGGPQTGYTVKVVESGSNHVFTIKKTAGWATHPVVVQVTEDQDTDVRLTVFSYDLPGVVRFPPQVNPAPSDFIKLRVSEDDGTPIEDVSWIDLVSGTPPDGMTATSAGPPDAQLEATAATTDPDALHDNVAAEIYALTDKALDPSILSDWVVIEDSEDSWAKKKTTVETLVGYSSPSKLGLEYSPALLYQMNDRTNIPNEGSVGHGQYDIVTSQCREAIFDDKVGQQKGINFVNDGSSECQTGLLSGVASTLYSLECTVQVVISMGGDAIPFRYAPSFDRGATLFSMKWQNTARVEIVWGLFLESDGVSQTQYYPSFDYHESTGTTKYTCRSPAGLMDYGRYIVQGRRQADGLGTYNTDLWVNGCKVASETLQPAPFVGVGSLHRIVHGTDNGNDGLERWNIFSSKYNGSALTDAQIHSEYKKALGYV